MDHWFGTIIENKADRSGVFYRRNRYYDQATGRFTQEDPIGLAGGLNLYGFAAGDPVNFSDPFGLCPPIDLCSPEQRLAMLARAGQLVSPLHRAAEGVGAVGLELSGVKDLERAVADGKVVGGAVALAGILPVGRAGVGLFMGIAKTIDKAQGAAVAFDRLGKFVRATWEVAGDKGAGYVRWNRILDADGNTVRLFKDVYDQGGKFLRRDWYVGGLPR
jgi:RHS repeat-associated protein